MNIDDFIKNGIKRPVQKEDKVYVYNGNDKLTNIYSTIELGREFFSMSNDAFHRIYGFNFIPKGRWFELSKRAAGKL